MQLFQIVDIHLIAIAVLIVVFFGLPKQIRQNNALFSGLVWVCVFALIVEFVTWVLDGSSWQYARLILYIANSVLIFLTILVPFLIFLYINYYIFPIIGRHSTSIPVLSAGPLIIGALLIGANLFVEILFYVDYLHFYQRGDWFWVIGVCAYIYFFFTLAKLWLGYKRLSRRELSIILFVPVAPAIGGLIQEFFYGAVSYWSGMTIAIVIIFLHLLKGELQTDYLTGAYNRRQLDNRIDDLLRNSKNGEEFAALFIDIDGFKMVNDLFGHGMGDQLLIDTVQLLQQSVRSHDFIARYGGDEFVLLLPGIGSAELALVIQRINAKLAEYNASKERGKKLSFSIGQAIFASGSQYTREEMLKLIDELMYVVKQTRAQ